MYVYTVQVDCVVYLADSVYVRELREEVGAGWELLDHQFHDMQQEGCSVNCVLHVRHTTQVLQVEGLQLIRTERLVCQCVRETSL